MAVLHARRQTSSFSYFQRRSHCDFGSSYRPMHTLAPTLWIASWHHFARVRHAYEHHSSAVQSGAGSESCVAFDVLQAWVGIAVAGVGVASNQNFCSPRILSRPRQHATCAYSTLCNAARYGMMRLHSWAERTTQGIWVCVMGWTRYSMRSAGTDHTMALACNEYRRLSIPCARLLRACTGSTFCFYYFSFLCPHIMCIYAVTCDEPGQRLQYRTSKVATSLIWDPLNLWTSFFADSDSRIAKGLEKLIPEVLPTSRLVGKIFDTCMAYVDRTLLGDSSLWRAKGNLVSQNWTFFSFLITALSLRSFTHDIRAFIVTKQSPCLKSTKWHVINLIVVV